MFECLQVVLRYLFVQNILFILFSQYSFIAAVGLVEDNAVVLVASMLVSPLMVCLYDIFFQYTKMLAASCKNCN